MTQLVVLQFPLEKYLKEFFMFLEQNVSGKCFPKNSTLVLLALDDFNNGFK